MQRQYDICVLGATGFTGERVLKYLSIQAGTNIEFAAAGRSQGKLEKVIQKLGLQCGIVSGVDANVDSSVLEMCQKCNIVLNCVGPYRYTGEVVVKACIQAKTNYLDVCGEPEFMERQQIQSLQHKFNARNAKRNKANQISNYYTSFHEKRSNLEAPFEVQTQIW
eukprot:TRINITY_DN5198_c0_g1_i2.p1 TRINITY_DN5198_c0_g1~~TRINITY_DN5198_c0_g1_i2.p1  ORF type:complete len:165 (-),score=13.19 TRINITY_DN5198_c0_g1_i2:70-564(-)